MPRPRTQQSSRKAKERRETPAAPEKKTPRRGRPQKPRSWKTQTEAQARTQQGLHTRESQLRNPPAQTRKTADLQRRLQKIQRPPRGEK